MQQVRPKGLRVTKGGGSRGGTTPAKPMLLDQMGEALRSRHCSRSTKQPYCEWVNQFVFFHIRIVQWLLGHKDVRTTMASYAHVLTLGGREIRSPADSL